MRALVERTVPDLLAYFGRRVTPYEDAADRLREELLVLAPPTDGAAVREAVDGLPDAQRELVLLVHGDGFSITDAARLVHVNPSTARTRYATALANLRAALVPVADDGTRLSDLRLPRDPEVMSWRTAVPLCEGDAPV
jgi:hypothetical protein